MKIRFLHIILSFNMLISLTGFSVSIHYCGDELMNLAIDYDASSCCDSSCNSCHNEHFYIKFDEDLAGPVSFHSPDIAQIDLLAPVSIIFNQPITGIHQIEIFCSESPPGRSGPDLFTTYQSFLL
ncbi:MAG: hypothetical protein KDC09_07700 [Bacteroidales bacterium]|nr:hypothetical protein [Bacteroidales bacterium]